MPRRLPPIEHSSALQIEQSRNACDRIEECASSGSAGFRSAEFVVAKTVLAVLAVFMHAAPANAGFCLSAQESADRLTGFLSTLQASSGELSLSGDSLTTMVGPKSDRSGAGSSETNTDRSTPAEEEPQQPPHPRKLAQLVSAGDFSGRRMSEPEPNSRSSSSSASGLSGARCRVQIPLLMHWLTAFESPCIPRKVLLEIFRPPP